MMVLMTCCNTRYATVTDTLNHACPVVDFTIIETLEIASIEANRNVALHVFSNASEDSKSIDRKIQKEAKIALFDALDKLSFSQLKAYGRYRNAI